MADEANEAAKKQLAANQEAQEKTHAEFAERMKGRPTPTQEENDLAALGAHLTEKSEDGSGPDPNVRHVEAKPGSGGGYQTRQAQPHPQAQPHRRERAAD